MSLGSRSSITILACVACLFSFGASVRRGTQSEEQAIRELDRKWTEAIAARDLDATVAHYADDAAFLAPGAPVTSGRAAIRSAWGDLLKSPGLSLTFGPTVVRIAHAADMAYEIGTFTMAMDGPHGRVEDQGKYVVVWTRNGGDWRVAADIFNSSRPPSPPAGS